MGLIELPWGVTEGNQGVELGGDTILDDNLLDQLTNFSVVDFAYSDPTSLSRDNYLDQLIQDYTRYDHQIIPLLDISDINILVGGDHSVSFGSYLWLSKSIDPNDLLIVHIDTHPDIMLIKESQTLNFHGKWQRPFFDTFDIAGIEKMIPNKLSLDNLIMFGNFHDEQANIDFLEAKNIPHFTTANWAKGLEILQAKQRDKHHIHISFDVDSLDQSIMPATGIPCQNGLQLSQLYQILDSLETNCTFSIDIVEYNPTKDTDHKSKQLLQDLIIHITQKHH
jgi:arginase